MIIREHSDVNTSKRLQETLELLWTGGVFILLSNDDYSFSVLDVVSSTMLFTFP